MKLRLDFLLVDLSQHFGIDLVVFPLKLSRWSALKVILCRKIKSHAATTQILNQKVSKLNKEKTTQRHSLKPKTNRNKCYLVRL